MRAGSRHIQHLKYKSKTNADMLKQFATCSYRHVISYQEKGETNEMINNLIDAKMWH